MKHFDKLAGNKLPVAVYVPVTGFPTVMRDRLTAIAVA